MKKFMFLFVAALVLVATGCTKIDNANQTGNLITELNLSIEGDTKVTVTKDNTGLKFAWKDGDIVYVYPAVAGNNEAITFTYSSSTGKFTAGGSGLTAGSDYYAVYGSSQTYENFNTDGKIKAAMNIAFYCSLDDLPMVSDIFTATADGTFATLHHTCGVVEIPFTGSGSIYYISINAYNSTTGDKYLRGEYDVTFNNEGEIDNIEKGSDNYYTRVYDSEYKDDSTPLTLSSTAQSVYFPVLPGSYNKVFVAWNNDANEIATNLSFTVERGKVHKKSTPINYTVE